MNEERRIKHDRVAGWLAGRGLDGVVLTRRCNFSWYTGGASNRVGDCDDVGASSLVVTRDGAKALSNNVEAARLAGEALPADIEVVEYPWQDGDARAAAFRAAWPGRFAADAPLAGLELPPTDADFDRLRWQLTSPEMDRYRAASRASAECLEAVARALQPGDTETALAGRINLALRAAGFVPWVTLVGSDERISRYRHPLPTDKPVRQYVMLITCADRGGLIVACTRLAAFGKVPDQIAARQRAVATVDAALIASTSPGATLGEIFAVAQKAYAQVGHGDQWRHHHQGGPIGYLPRDAKATPGSPIVVLPDQAFAWNPSITGAKSEDTTLCRPAGCEVLTHTGNWPTIEASWQGRTIPRPDILVL